MFNGNLQGNGNGNYPLNPNISHLSQAQAQAQIHQNNNSNASALPPLVLNARLHELVIAGAGQNERLEPAIEHVIKLINYRTIQILFF